MLKIGLTACLVFGALTGSALAFDDQQPGFFPSPADYSWDGYYLGINGGYAKGTFADGTAAIPGNDLSPGAFAGVQAGYNFTLSPGLVVGLEGDVDHAWASGETDVVTAGPVTSNFTDVLDWTAAMTGHVGFAWDRMLPYALGGVAFAGNEVTQRGTDFLGPFEADTTKTHIGWTAGVGLGAMLTSNISGFAEYRYSDYGSQDYDTDVATDTVKLTSNSVRMGLNFHMR